MTPTCWATEKISKLKWVEKAETYSHHKLRPGMVTYNWEGTPNSQLFPEKQNTSIFKPANQRLGLKANNFVFMNPTGL